MQNVYLQRITEKSRPPAESKQTQFKPNSNPIQSQTKPIMNQKLGYQSQFKPKQTQFSKDAKSVIHSPMQMDVQKV